MAVNKATTRRDLMQIKSAGANVVRLCHYPHDPSELSMRDEIGLLVFAEIPLYFWNDSADGRRNQKIRIRNAKRQIAQMIERDINHASVIFWSVSNETPEQIETVAADNASLVQYARELDPSRLCVHVSNHWRDHPSFDADDVVCVNGYPSMVWGDGKGEPAPDPKNSGETWRNRLAKLHKRYSDRPVLITEFGYCSFPGTFGHRFGEDSHALVIESEFSGLDSPFICGAIIWCWADHPWPAGRFLGGLAISPFGVLSRDRRPLLPFHAAAKVFRKRQGLEA